MPKFSVVIPLFNKEKDILATINSVLNQSYSNFEVIIIDDGSTDLSVEIINKIKDDRINLFTKKNEGVSIARNLGVANASSTFIAFLDADDYWYPDHLEKLDSLTNLFPNGKWFATAYEKKYHENFTSPMNSSIFKNGSDWNGIVNNYFENSLIDCLAWTSAVCMRKDFFVSLNGFDTKITHGAGEDTDLWLRAALNSELIFSAKITATHNLDGSNRISNTPTLKRSYMDLNKYENLSKDNEQLKIYLDLNRYSFAIQHKISNDLTSYKKYLKDLNINNLNSKQRFLLKQPRLLLISLIRVKGFLERFGMRLSSF
jgi:glycosyltransferase involved in cell wall biosynthesis